VNPTRRRLVAILVVSLGIRLGVWGLVVADDPRRFWDADTWSYHWPARALLEHGEFAPSPEKLGVAETSRTPGYPAFLALVYTVFGESAAAVSLVQILVGVVTVALTFAIGRRLAGPEAGLAGALVFALDPVSLTFHEILMTEALFVFLVTAAAVAGLRALSTSGAAAAAAVGFWIALATLVRPASYFLALPVALVLAGLLSRAPSARRLAVAAAVLAPVILLVGGWQLRNYARTSHADFSTILDDVALRSRAAMIVAWQEDVTLRDAGRQLEAAIPATDDVGEREHRKRDVAWGVIRAHPFLFLSTSVVRAVRMMCGPGEPRLVWLLGHPTPVSPGIDLQRVALRDYARKWLWPPRWPFALFLYAAIYLAILDVSVVAALWTRTRELGREDLFLWTIVGYFFAVGMTSSRFRVPIMPLLAVYAAQGLLGVSQAVASRASRSAAPPGEVTRRR
jgi:4-amino-4-deoxy-L-arabinose transferase-like glycosyltransferase